MRLSARRRTLAPRTPRTSSWGRQWRLAALLLAVTATASCTAGGTVTSEPSSVVVQPGRPGEQATTIAPEDFEAPGDPYAAWNEADAEFVTAMIGHHAQALEMSALAPDRSASEQVKTMADRIAAAQSAEIHALAAWLDARTLPVPVEAEAADGSGPRVPAEDDEHGHGELHPGMLTGDELAGLGAATGADFDRLFCELMIRHHRGAIDMAQEQITTGNDVYAGEMATDAAAEQSAEIARLEDILAGL
jgi:uncharacterized protein (DUF305 family)